jgi:hypothetical protein
MLYHAVALIEGVQRAEWIHVRGSTPKVLVDASSATSIINWRPPGGPSKDRRPGDSGCKLWGTLHPVAPKRPLLARSWHDQDLWGRAP